MPSLTARIEFRSATLAPLLRRVGALHVTRGVVFIGTLLLGWISLRPFTDLTNLSTDFGSGNDTWTYIWFGLLAVLTPSLALTNNARGLRSLASASFIAMVGWMSVTVVLSLDHDASIRRFIMTICVMVVTASLLLLPQSQRELTRWLAAATLAVLALCYLGVIFAPELSIHQARDILEPHLAGDWRGVFGHKNGAATVMALFCFIGLYAATSGAPIAGSAIFLLAFVFLVFTGSKSSLAMCIVVLAITSVVARLPSPRARAVICLTPLVAINLLSVGTVVSEGLANVAHLLPFDTSFTGRTDIWRFALEALAARPLIGYGFSAFWGANGVAIPDAGSEWAAEAANSHNGYLDAALTMGIPGLVLLIVVLVIVPMRNYAAAEQRGNGGPLTMMFLRIWLFGIYVASMEAFFLDRAQPMWFTFLLAVFGLHYGARFKVRA